MSAPKLVSFSAGEVLFKEGEVGQHAYIIKEGVVRITKLVDDKVVTLGELKNGACFGEMAVISNAARVATATAITHCQAYKIDKSNVEHMMNDATPLFRAILMSLIKRVTNLNEAIGESSSISDPYLSLSNLLLLLARAENQVATAGSQNSTQREVNLDLAIEQIRLILGRTRKNTRAVLEKMAKLNLIILNTQQEVPTLTFDSATLIKDTQQMLEFLHNKPMNLSAKAEFVDIEEMAKEVGTFPKRLMEAIWAGKIDEAALYFHRQTVIDCLNRNKQSAKLLS